MTRLIGHSALLVALFVAAVGVILAPIGVKRARQDLVRAMYSATYAMFALAAAPRQHAEGEGKAAAALRPLH